MQDSQFKFLDPATQSALSRTVPISLNGNKNTVFLLVDSKEFRKSLPITGGVILKQFKRGVHYDYGMEAEVYKAYIDEYIGRLPPKTQSYIRSLPDPTALIP